MSDADRHTDDQEGKRAADAPLKRYSRPTILSRQRLEAVATTCGKTGTETPVPPLCAPLQGGTVIS